MSRLALIVICLIALSGCSQLQSNLVAPSVTPDRVHRKAEALKMFETHRDFAQLEAALDFWKADDPEHCESLLTALVDRRPDFVEARLRLGELLMDRGEMAAAEGHLQAAVSAQPHHAEAHHALGLLLEAADRRAEAANHLAKAAELDPQNDIYRVTRDSVPDKTAVSRR